jgi:predicted acetyltransferase
MAEPYPIRAIAADEFAALAEVPDHAFGVARPPEAIERDRLVIEYDRTIAAFDGAQMIGSAAAYSFQVTVPGATAAAAGITYVAVQPTYRRRGVLSGLMEWLLADAAARAEPLAILFASEAGIYGRFGFGMASQDQRFQFHRDEGTLMAGPEAPGREAPRLRAAAPEHARPELASVFDAVCARQPGMLARNARWWDYMLADPPALRPSGASPLRCVIAEDDHGPRGYVLFRAEHSWSADHLPAGSLRIRELISADPAATAALWSDMLSRDLVSEIVAPMRPIDDPLLAMLADPRRARPSPSDGLWVRLIDVPAALRARQYAAPADLVLEVADAVRPGNAGRWRLRIPGGQAAGGLPRCEPTGDPADLRLPVQALGAAYLGRPCLGQLASAGHIAELTPGSLATLSCAMSWEPAPFSPMMF